MTSLYKEVDGFTFLIHTSHDMEPKVMGVKPPEPSLHPEDKRKAKVMFSSLTRIFGEHADKEVRRLRPQVDRINGLGRTFPMPMWRLRRARIRMTPI
jgi:hypothetical protein